MGTYENPTVFTPGQQGGGGSNVAALLQMSQQLVSRNQAKKAEKKAKLEKEAKITEKEKEAFEDMVGGTTNAGVSRNIENADALNFDPEVTKGLNATLYNQMLGYQNEANALYYANPNMSKSEQDKIQGGLVTRAKAATKGLSLLKMVNDKKEAMMKAGKMPIDNNALWDMTSNNGKDIKLIFKDDEQYFEYTDSEGEMQTYNTNDLQELLTREQGPFNTKATLDAGPRKTDPAYPLHQFITDKDGPFVSYLNKDGTIKHGKKEELKTFLIESGTMAGFNDPLVAESYYVGFQPSTAAFAKADVDDKFQKDFDSDEWYVEQQGGEPTGQVKNLYDEVFDFYLPPEGKKPKRKKKSTTDEVSDEVKEIIAAADEAAVEETDVIALAEAGETKMVYDIATGKMTPEK